MRSIAYDVIDRRIVIAQTVPLLAKYNLNREITLNFIIKKGGNNFSLWITIHCTRFYFSSPAGVLWLSSLNANPTRNYAI